MQCIKRCLFTLAACFAFLATPALAQQTYRWSDTSPTFPCGFTLQECIDLAVDGDTIEVAALNPIHEDLLIQAGITLKGVNGLPSGPLAGARLAAGRDITVLSLNDGGDVFTAKLENITLERGQVFVRHLNFETTSIVLDRIQILDVDPTSPSAAGILFEHAGSGFFDAAMWASGVFFRTTSSTPRAALLFRRTETGTGSSLAQLFHNRLWNVSATDTNMLGMDLQLDSPTAMSSAQAEIRILGNDIRGPGLTSGIKAEGSNLLLSIQNNLIVGQSGASIADASISLYRNSIVGPYLVAINNNTLADGNRGIRVLADLAPQSIQISNNIFARLSNLALSKVDGAGSITLDNHHNLFYQTGGSSVALGAGTVYGNPGFRGAGDYRLTAASAARNAGAITSNTADASGYFRVQEGTVDIGAYEFGSESFRHTGTPQNTAGSGTSIDRTSLTGSAAGTLRLMVTDNPYEFLGLPAFDPNPLGTMFQPTQSRWLIRHQNNMQPMGDIARGFQVLALSETVDPDSGGGLFTHSVTLNSLGTSHGPHVSLMDHASTTMQPDALVFITGNLTSPAPLSVRQPNNHPVAVYYSSGTWRVFNTDYEPTSNPDATMPVGAAFDVFVPPAARGFFIPNAFRVAAPTELSSSNYFELDHPLLNGNPCATLQLTQYWAGNAAIINRHEVGVFYHIARGRWRIWNRDGEAMPEGAQFNVYVDSGEAVACQLRDTFKLGVLFEDSFE